MQNPFEYGGIVEQPAFCNRTQELAEIHRVCENAERMFLYSERRLGKTSLLKLALARLPKKAFSAIYVDLWPTNNGGTFALALAKAIAESAATSANKLLEMTRTFFAALQPYVKIDEEGRPVVAFGISREGLAGPTLDNVLSTLRVLSKQSQKRLVVVLDEFQQICEYPDNTIESKIRSAVQQHSGIAYIFSGSKKHLIRKMFLDKNRPLYRSAKHFPLEPIKELEWQPFISKQFNSNNKKIAAQQIHRIYELTEGHPFYVQHLCHTAWELTDEGIQVDDRIIEESVNLLLKRENYAFTVLWESLAVNQRAFLVALAFSEGQLKPFSTDFLQRSGLRTPPNIQRVVGALLQRDIIDQDSQGSYVISDRFFRIWIKRTNLSLHRYQ